MPEAAALVVEDLSVNYGGFKAVDGLSLDVPEGAVRGLIGPNGAGKTTAFNALCGYIAPSSGRVWIHGRRVRPKNPIAAWKAGVARTFQRTEIFWTLTVREHVQLARRLAATRGLHPLPGDEILAMLGLTDFESTIGANLPLGTLKLVELARAIATGSNFILMDEPCSGLDRRETSLLEGVLREIQPKMNLTLLIVEHDMEFILGMASHIFVLDSGELIASGTPDEIRNSPEVRKAYLGTARPVSAPGNGLPE
jgi:ABC-type branched-subunit amino acid transport system ATPase component